MATKRRLADDDFARSLLADYHRRALYGRVAQNLALRAGIVRTTPISHPVSARKYVCIVPIKRHIETTFTIKILLSIFWYLYYLYFGKLFRYVPRIYCRSSLYAFNIISFTSNK